MTPTSSIGRAEAIAPGLARQPLLHHLKQWGPWVLFFIAFIAICVDINLSPATLMRGLGRLATFLAAMIPPDSGGDFWRIAHALAETFAMAFAGTALAIVFAVPLGIIGAKNIVSFSAAHFLIRRFYDMFRGVPALVWALILVSAFGLGPFGGVIALMLADLPVLSKLYAEALENIDEKQPEAMRACGCGKICVLRYGVAPQVTPVIASQGLYYLESNFRNAAILGIVGAGGIGFELEERIRVFAFDQVAFIILLYIICVAALDSISARLRASIS